MHPELRRILIVEDDSAIRETLVMLLSSEGYAVQGAANGEVALSVLKRDAAFGMILLDLLMPTMNGWEFRAIQSADPALSGIPVVVMTANPRPIPEELKAHAILSKPIDLDALLKTAERICGAPGPQRHTSIDRSPLP